MENRVVCFDIGGVLIRIVKTWTDAVVRSGIYPDTDGTSEIRVADGTSALRGIPEGPFYAFEKLDPYQKGDLSLPDYLTSLGGHLGIEDPDDVLRVHNAILMEEYAGVSALVEELAQRGVLTACLSNTNAPHFEEMLQSGRFPVIGRLNSRFASHEMGLNKPDPAIFEEFERKVEAKPKDVVFFDDSQANVEAARARGWFAARVDPDGDPAVQMRSLLMTLGVLLPDR